MSTPSINALPVEVTQKLAVLRTLNLPADLKGKVDEIVKEVAQGALDYAVLQTNSVYSEKYKELKNKFDAKVKELSDKVEQAVLDYNKLVATNHTLSQQNATLASENLKLAVLRDYSFSERYKLSEQMTALTKEVNDKADQIKKMQETHDRQREQILKEREINDQRLTLVNHVNAREACLDKLSHQIRCPVFWLDLGSYCKEKKAHQLYLEKAKDALSWFDFYRNKYPELSAWQLRCQSYERAGLTAEMLFTSYMKLP